MCQMEPVGRCRAAVCACFGVLLCWRLSIIRCRNQLSRRTHQEIIDIICLLFLMSARFPIHDVHQLGLVTAQSFTDLVYVGIGGLEL